MTELAFFVALTILVIIAGLRTLLTRTVNRSTYQRLVGIEPHRIDLPIAPRRPGHS